MVPKFFLDALFSFRKINHLYHSKIVLNFDFVNYHDARRNDASAESPLGEIPVVIKMRLWLGGLTPSMVSQEWLPLKTLLSHRHDVENIY